MGVLLRRRDWYVYGWLACLPDHPWLERFLGFINHDWPLVLCGTLVRVADRLF